MPEDNPPSWSFWFIDGNVAEPSEVSQVLCIDDSISTERVKQMRAGKTQYKQKRMLVL